MANKDKPALDKTLFQLTSFRLALSLPAFVALILALFIGLNSNLVFDFSYKGFNFLCVRSRQRQNTTGLPVDE